MGEDDGRCPVVGMGVGGCFFWYRPTRVVPDKRLCVCVFSCVCYMCGLVDRSIMVRALNFCEIATQQLCVKLLILHFQVTTLGKIFAHVPLSPSSIIWYRSRGSDALQLGR